MGSAALSGVRAVLQLPHELTITESPNKCIASERRWSHTPPIAPPLTPGAIVISTRGFEDGFVPEKRRL